LAAIDVKTNLVIEQVNLDAKAQAQLRQMYGEYLNKSGQVGTIQTKKEFYDAAKRQGMDRGEKAQQSSIQKFEMNPLGVAMKGLTSIIEVGIKNSKIVQTFQKKVAEALGLLVDLILMPFLPLLIGALIALFEGVIWFGELWEKFAEPIVLSLEKVATAIDNFLNPKNPDGSNKTTIDRLFDFAKVLDAIARFMVIDLPLAILGGLFLLVGTITQMLIDLGWEIGIALADAVWSVLMPWYIKFKLFWNDLTKGLSDTIVSLGSKFLKFYLDIETGYYNLKNKVLGAIESIIYSIQVAAVNAYNVLANAYNSTVGQIPGVPKAGTSAMPSAPASRASVQGVTTGSGAGWGVGSASKSSATAPQINTIITGNVYGVDDLNKKITSVMRTSNNSIFRSGIN